MKPTYVWCIVATIAAQPALSQEKHATEDREHASAAERALPDHHATIESLVGADVHFDTTRTAAAGQSTDRRQDREKVTIGTVEDLLLAANGSVEWVVLECDDTQRLVAPRELSWDRDEECFWTGLNEAALKARTEFDLEEARERGLAKSLVAASGERSTQVREASYGTPKRFAATAFSAAPEAYLCGSEVDELTVFGMDEEFGGVSKTFVDTDSMSIDLVVVSRGGLAGIGDTSYLMPFGELAVCREPSEEGEDAGEGDLLLCVDITVESLEGAPEYVEPEEDGVLVAASNRMQAVRFFERAGRENEVENESDRKK